MLQVKSKNGNTLKDSFYKERLIKSSANSMYNTLNKGMKTNDDESDDDVEGVRKLSVEQENLKMEDHLKDFGKTSEGSSYAFLKFECTHKMLRSINKIRPYQFLEHIDLSYNKLKTLKYLSGLRYLIRVVATHNELTSIFDVKSTPLHLDTLVLSHNQIERMNDLSSHKHLRILKLRGNKITQMEGISKNLELEVLELSENNIEEIGGLDGLNIKQLYLSNNSLETIKGMTKLEHLRVLDLSNNKVNKLSGLINLISLRNLNLSKNSIKNVREIDYLENLIYLSDLDLCYNPIQERRYYRTQMIYKLPMLKNLDGCDLSSQEVVAAQEFYGLYVEEKFNIFKEKLPEEQFIDRRIHKSELIENETDSEGEQNNFIDDYDEDGKIRSHSSKSKNKSFNNSKRSTYSKGSKKSVDRH